VNLILLGLNHRTAPVEVRECLAPAAEALPGLLRQALLLPGVREAFFVSTCNRVEVLAAAEEAKEAGPALMEWLLAGKPVTPEQAAQALYRYQDEDAVRHLFRVASSLDSMVLGEPQILGQIKEAYRLATQAGSTRTVLNRLLHKTFQVAKRVRTETSIGGAAVSVSFAAVELAKKIFDDLKGLNALLIGAGEMAELAAEHLKNQGVARVLVANRTLERAVELSRRLGGGGAYGLDDLPEVLGQADIVISSTGSPEAIITHDLTRRALKKRRGRPVFFIDIAVPRDVEPKVAEIEGCFVYDIDDLTQVVEANRQGRQEQARAAERIVAEEVVKFSRWLRSLDVVPTIAELTGKAETIREAELGRTLRDLNGISPEQAQAVDRLTKAVVKKVLHDPILFLKDQSHIKSEDTKRNQLALIRRMFKLGEEENK